MEDITTRTLPKIDLSAINQKLHLPEIEPPDFNHQSRSLTGVYAEQPDFRPNWHQLIIVGNGFDLECGLPSGFRDYINARNKVIKECESDETLSYTLTIWDAILAGMPNANWCDIEGAISNWMAPDGVEPLSEGTLFAKCLNILINYNPTVYDPNNVEEVVAPQLYRRFPNYWGSWTSSRLLDITMKDLHILEEEFAKYLQGAVSRSDDYKDRASKLMIELMIYERPREEEYDIQESILSFNYTRAVKHFRSKEHRINYVNVHGRLGGEIVFGIDGSRIMSNELVVPFTKTYRVMALNPPDIEKIVDVPTNASIYGHGTRVIKFYGHSLGKADYSYFQAIFDAVNLYEGETKLIFFFRPHGQNSGEFGTVEEAKKDAMSKAIALLTAYGATLDNKDHGTNLIHKLLIEGRLVVVLLPDTVHRTD